MRRSIVMAALFSSVVLSGAAFAASKGDVKKGACAIVAGATAHGKYATLKCYLNDSPGNYVIRKTVFERDDKKEYRDLARYSGRRMKCDFSVEKKTRQPRSITTHYKLSNCH